MDTRINFVYMWRLKFRMPLKEALNADLGELIKVRYVLDFMEFINDYMVRDGQSKHSGSCI